MKCFDVVQTVLDATYENVPDTGGKRDEIIAAALGVIAEQYAMHLMSKGGPDFSNPATRFGYVYKYVPAHAHWLFDLMEQRPEVGAVFQSGKARLTCIGGGPGSEIVGALKYLDENEIECKLFCELIDYCEEWKSTWSDVTYELDWKHPLHTDYIIHDVGNKDTWNSPTKIDKADIVILSFFVSEVIHTKRAKEYLVEMFGRMKSDALILVNDNRTKEVYELVDDAAAKTGFKTIFQDANVQKVYDSGEELSRLKKYADKFVTKSKLTHNMFRRIYQKK